MFDTYLKVNFNNYADADNFRGNAANPGAFWFIFLSEKALRFSLYYSNFKYNFKYSCILNKLYYI